MKTNQDNPWKTLKSSERFDNPWIKIIENDCLNPAGHPAKYTVVHFKNLAVAIIPLDQFGFTYLVGQYRYPNNSYEWELPKGGCPKDEDPLDAAKRELLEETGLIAKDYKKFLELIVSDCVTDEIAYAYLARDLTQAEACPEDTEKLEVKKIHFNDVYQMVLDGEIRDALSVAAILKLKVLLDKN